MSRPPPNPKEYKLDDDGRLVIRCLGSRRYIGLRIPQFESVPGRNANAVVQNYDLRVYHEHMKAAGMDYGSGGPRRRVGKAQKLNRQLAFNYLRKKQQ